MKTNASSRKAALSTLIGAAAGLFFGLWRENSKKRAECERQLARWLH